MPEELHKQPQEILVEDKKSVLKNVFSFVGFLFRAAFIYLGSMFVGWYLIKNYLLGEQRPQFYLSGTRSFIISAIITSLPLLFSALSLPRFRRSICCILAISLWLVTLLPKAFQETEPYPATEINWLLISCLSLINLIFIGAICSDSRLNRIKESFHGSSAKNKPDTNAEKIVDKLTALGVNLKLKDEKIYAVPRSKVTPEMLPQMREHRDELVALLLEKEDKATALTKYGLFSRYHYIVTMLFLGIGLAWFCEDVVAKFGTAYFYLLCTGVFLAPVFLRIKNIGYDKRWFILFFIPVVSIFVLIDCLFRPEGYADRKPTTSG